MVQPQGFDMEGRLDLLKDTLRHAADALPGYHRQGRKKNSFSWPLGAAIRIPSL
jgi:hypothetical protein